MLIFGISVDELSTVVNKYPKLPSKNNARIIVREIVRIIIDFIFIKFLKPKNIGTLHTYF